MARDAPDPSNGDQPRPNDPTTTFAALVERAEVIAARGREREQALDEAARTGAPAPEPATSYRRGSVVLVLTALTLLAGVLAWSSSRTSDTTPQSQRPGVTTSTAPVVTTTTEAAVTTTAPEATTTTVVPTPSTTPTTAPGGPVVTPPDEPPGGENPDAGPVLHHTVLVGESFWVIAEHEVARVSPAPTNAEIAHYWQTLIAANAGHLAQPGNPDLILPGQVFTVPPVLSG